MDYDGNLGYAFTRLRDSFVWWEPEKTLVKVLRREHDNGVLVQTTTRRELFVPLEEFSFRAPVIGNVNAIAEGFSGYLERIPLRGVYRQGLTPQQFLLYKCQKRYTNASGMFSHHLEDVIRAMRREYPTFDECCDSLEEGMTSVAISSSFSITEGNSIYYRGRTKVGNLKKGRVLCLMSKYVWLRERLEEETGKQVDCNP